MKKLLGLLGAVGLVATTSATVVSCGNKANDTSKVKFEKSFEDRFKNGKLELFKGEKLEVSFDANSKNKGADVDVVSDKDTKVKANLSSDKSKLIIEALDVTGTGENEVAKIKISSNKDSKPLLREITVTVSLEVQFDNTSNDKIKNGLLTIEKGENKAATLTIVINNKGFKVEDLEVVSAKSSDVTVVFTSRDKKIKITGINVTTQDVKVTIKAKDKDSKAGKEYLSFNVKVTNGQTPPTEAVEEVKMVDDDRTIKFELVNTNKSTYKIEKNISNGSKFDGVELQPASNNNNAQKNKISAKLSADKSKVEFICADSFDLTKDDIKDGVFVLKGYKNINNNKELSKNGIQITISVAQKAEK